MPYEKLSMLWMVPVVVYDAFDSGESKNLTDYSGCVYLVFDIVYVRKKKHRI